MKPKTYIISTLLFLLAIGTYYFFAARIHRNIHRSFYYWKSVYHLSSEEEILIDTLHIQRLYVKYFDVDWNEVSHQAIPLATIDFTTPINPKTEIIPTIFITNKTFVNIEKDKVTELAEKIATRIKQINEQNKIHCKEIQFDCDWNDKTKSDYFFLLEKMRTFFPKEKFLLSATIRLHQIKYPQRTGTPPVDRGMLMFYNIGKLNNINTTNSIFNTEDAEKYVGFISKYSLPLDVALPIFTWGVHFRNSKVISLVNNLQAKEIMENKLFFPIKNNYFTVKDGCFFRGEYFTKGDILRMEEITPDLCKEAINLLLPYLKNTNFTVAFYHFDSSNTSRYEIQDFKNMYHRFE